MSWFVSRWWGKTVRELPAVQFAEVIEELRDSDDEHGSVALEHESGWSLSYGRRGTLILEKVDSDSPADRFHQKGVSPAYVSALWELLSRGALDQIRREPWLTGYGE